MTQRGTAAFLGGLLAGRDRDTPTTAAPVTPAYPGLGAKLVACSIVKMLLQSCLKCLCRMNLQYMLNTWAALPQTPACDVPADVPVDAACLQNLRGPAWPSAQEPL